MRLSEWVQAEVLPERGCHEALLDGVVGKELAHFVSSKLSTLETVTGTSTSFVLKRYKEEGVIFETEKTDNRLVISP